ncbi:hypothetical protein MKW98_017986 [Papaver atlanticum]|uniref:Uncharacterized protein n=1 Tax=Papaver atlanticum TaxID=357466 RepID=A0AAD4TF41_9MAGN|nr:hypothetical protein MKW98_017986 [Papaver atlanticum]
MALGYWTTSDEDGEEMSGNDEAAEGDKEMPNENKVDVKDATLEYVLPRTREEGILAYDESVKRFKECQPELKSWIHSWPEVNQTGTAWLNVYGYCDKDKGHGGYGVILRNSLVRPIIAATWFSQVGGSQLFQVLSGIKTGIDLAVKYGYLRLSVCCNAQKAVELLGSSTFRTAGTCHLRDRSIHKVKTGSICRACTKRRLSVRGSSLEILIPVIKELKVVQAKFDESNFRLTKVVRDQNEPAHYLARSAEGNAVEAPKEIQPADFPHELGEYLWNDAFDCDTMYFLW